VRRGNHDLLERHRRMLMVADHLSRVRSHSSAPSKVSSPLASTATSSCSAPTAAKPQGTSPPSVAHKQRRRAR
jgi:hypothetical protein